MIRFKGRSLLKQYNPMKPIKRGYKLWCLANITGYVYKFDVYTGKKADDGNGNDNLREVGLGGKVVWHLVEHLCGKNHTVFFDNFFSSIPLLDILRMNKILACGTIRANRQYFPTLATDKSLKRGDFDCRTSSTGLSLYKWCDNKSVHLISNFHAVSATTVERKQKDGSKKKLLHVPKL